MAVKHEHDGNCPACADKLEEAHLDLERWFYHIKEKFPEVHVACSYRNEADQESAFHSGNSHDHFPNSPHNKEVNGNPCSMAIDLFQMDEHGKGSFDLSYYEKIAAYNEANNIHNIKWGGTFRGFIDAPHFELII